MITISSLLHGMGAVFLLWMVADGWAWYCSIYIFFIFTLPPTLLVSARRGLGAMKVEVEVDRANLLPTRGHAVRVERCARSKQRSPQRTHAY